MAESSPPAAIAAHDLIRILLPPPILVVAAGGHSCYLTVAEAESLRAGLDAAITEAMWNLPVIPVMTGARGGATP